MTENNLSNTSLQQPDTDTSVVVEDKKPSLKERWKERKKRYFFRKVVKDIKRVRWPSPKENWKNLAIILVFTILFALFVYGVTIGFTQLWSVIHAG
ncbi:preprotein translocase subunit SecE [Mycoplasmopsis verecunda]|uniref:Preprotein translocase subunit SecE n=1 Tax=Mycoplasmopsis verecunda TaxID=171291 RepID=A0A1T4L6U2_9BACT|nr:preprotein translocase subunit SecE [Mycoplasmopsis verecunda]WPB54780.1 preprotein translocase subunit SecE [Mycoplasmopsis verecunda]SJZ50307.1 preprotein translocase subunit SecE [Mycoplasmopsis verecunda]